MLPVPRWMSSLLDLGNCLIKLSDSIFSAIAQNSSCSSLPVIHRTGLSMCHVDLKWSIHTFSSNFFCHCLNIPHLLFCLQICGSVLPVAHSIREPVHRAFYLTQWLFSLPVFQFGFPPPSMSINLLNSVSKLCIEFLIYSIVCSLWNSFWMYLHPLWCLWTYLYSFWLFVYVPSNPLLMKAMAVRLVS